MRYDVEAAKKAGVPDKEIINQLVEKQPLTDVKGRSYDVKGARDAGVSDAEIVSVLIRGRGFDRSGSPVQAFGRGVAVGATQIFGAPGDAINAIGEGIISRPPESSPFYEAVPAPKPSIIGSQAIRGGLERLSPGSTYENLGSLPPGERPLAAMGEVFGAGGPIVGGAMGAAKAGVQGPKLIQPIMRMAKESPGAFAAVETASLAGAAQGAGLAELYFPGEPGVRVGAEIAGGFLNPLGLVLKLGKSTARTVTDFATGFTPSGVEARYAKTLQDALAAAGEDPVKVASALRRIEFAGVNLTAGQKSGSPTLLAMERKIAAENAVFGMKAKQRVVQSWEALRNIADDLTKVGVQTNSPEALKQAAKARQAYHEGLIASRFAKAQQDAMTAWAKVDRSLGKTGYLAGTPNPQEASASAYRVIRDSISDARKVEGELWEKIDKTIPLKPNATIDAYDNLRSQLLKSEGIDPVVDAEIARIRKYGATSGEIIRMRSRLLRLGREAAATPGGGDKAWQYGTIADGLLEDISQLPGDTVDTARAFSKSLNDSFSRTFAGDILSTDKAGAAKVYPEMVLETAFGRGGTAADINFKQLAEAAGFTGKSPELELAAAIRGEHMLSEQEKFLRYAAQRTTKADGTVNLNSLQGFVRENEAILQRFPILRAQLADAESAQVAFKEAEKLKDIPRAAIQKRNAFGRLFGFESPSEAIGEVLKTKNPERNYYQLVRAAKSTGLTDGLKVATLEHAMTEASKNGFSFSIYNKALTQSMSGRGPSVLEVMERSGVMGRREAVLTRRLLKRADELETAIKNGDRLEKIIGEPDAVTDLVIRIVGSRIGASGAAGAATGASLVAAGAGSRFLRNLFNKIPNTRVMKVAEEAAMNPEFAAMLLEKPRSLPKARQLESQINAFLLQAGITYEDEEGN